MNIIKRTIFILLATLFIPSCSHKENVYFRDGELENLVYINKYFGLTIQFTDNWKIGTINENKELEKKTINLIANDNEEIRNNAFRLMKKNAILLNLKNINDSSSIIIGAEDIKGRLRPKNNNKYFVELKSVLNQTHLNYKYLNQIDNSDISDNIKWGILQTSFNNEVYQDFYITMYKEYYIVIICTYDTEVQKKNHEQIIKAIKMDKP